MAAGTITRKAVFLDRDGVLNAALVREGKPYPPATIQELRLLPGVVAACQRLKTAGYLLVVATNQPDVGRGTLSREQVDAMHDYLGKILPLDRIEVCYEADDGAGCACRKPRPGMLLRAAGELGIDLAASYMIGDRWRDIDCGRAAGCTTILIDYGYAESLRAAPHYSVKSLPEAVEIIMNEDKRTSAPATHPKNQLPTALQRLRVSIYADGADKASMVGLYANPLIKGLTTNPTLMKKVGITHYEDYARDILQTVRDKPISFEVFSDDFPEMRRQALKIAQWQKNVYVKIPITNTRGESALPLIRELSQEGVQLNITAILTLEQVRGVAAALQPTVPAVVSVFAGRIADTGRDPDPIMRASLALLGDLPQAELLWASVREVLNIFQADAAGCHIVTVPHDILHKAIKTVGTELQTLSLDTVKMFAQDAQAAGFSL